MIFYFLLFATKPTSISLVKGQYGGRNVFYDLDTKNIAVADAEDEVTGYFEKLNKTPDPLLTSVPKGNFTITGSKQSEGDEGILLSYSEGSPPKNYKAYMMRKSVDLVTTADLKFYADLFDNKENIKDISLLARTEQQARKETADGTDIPLSARFENFQQTQKEEKQGTEKERRVAEEKRIADEQRIAEEKRISDEQRKNQEEAKQQGDFNKLILEIRKSNYDNNPNQKYRIVVYAKELAKKDPKNAIEVAEILKSNLIKDPEIILKKVNTFLGTTSYKSLEFSWGKLREKESIGTQNVSVLSNPISEEAPTGFWIKSK